jgi:hypothetical protein
VDVAEELGRPLVFTFAPTGTLNELVSGGPNDPPMMNQVARNVMISSLVGWV